MSKTIRRNFIDLIFGKGMQKQIRRRLLIISVGYDLAFRRS